LLLVAGCYHGDDPPNVLHPELAIDVLVRAADVRVYVHPVDTAVDENLLFPEVGECLVHDDVGEIIELCLTEVSVDGIAANLDFGGEVYIGAFVDDASVLTLRGCGSSETRIPLHAGAFPVTRATVSSAGDVHTVSWTADPTAASTLVFGGGGFGGEVCHLPAGVHEHTFEFPLTLHTSFYVQPLLPVELTGTELGAVRVWRGNTFVPI
jgi:hypothetical protein